MGSLLALGGEGGEEEGQGPCPSSDQMTPKLGGRQQVSSAVEVEEVKKAVLSMKKTALQSYLKSHHLLQNCGKTDPEQLPKPGDMVWARSLGSVYWPAFVAKMADRHDLVANGADEIDETTFTFVMFLEETFRFAPIKWNQIIPFQDYKVQEVLFSKFNNVIQKHSWKPSTGYKKALDLIDEFVNLPPLERQDAAINRFEVTKEGQAKKKGTEVPVRKTATDDPDPEEPSEPPVPVAEEIKRVVSQTKVKKKYGLRVSERIVEHQIGKLKSQSKSTVKKKTEKPVAEKTPKKPNEKARPDVGGEILKQWTKDRFDGISKQFVFDTTKPASCRECNVQFAENEAVKTCHGMPYHESCLLSAPDTDAEGSTTLKCSNCINQLCFLCKIPSVESNVAFKCTRCDLRFHIDCLQREDWPQAKIQGSNGPITCPFHFCHTCLGEQRTSGKCRDYTVNPSKTFKCSLCLSTYHKMCLPAGCGEDIQGKEYIVCPRHKVPELKIQRRIGCMTCCKALKAKEDRVECQLCIQAFHPACVGYTGHASETHSLDVFGKNYKCFTCKLGLFPLYGQVVWYQQPQSQYWPARILYPSESKRRVNGIKRFPGQYSVEYFGQTSYYDNASRTIPLLLTTIDIFKVMKVYQDTRNILRAHEEADFFLQFAESYRDRALPKPKPVYKKIERNVYRTAVAQKVKEPSDVCSCSKSDESEFICLADSGCSNRDMYMECSDRICKGKSRCKNRMFTEKRNDEDFLEQRPFPNKGWGIVAKQDFNPGDFVCEYLGEVIDRTEMLWRSNKKEEEDPMYILEMSKVSFIDAEYVGNQSRLINHSCNPNCEISKYLSQGKSVGGIFARRRIEIGEEITFNYDCGSQSTTPFRCRCGSSSCLVFVGKEIPEGFQVADDDDDIGSWDDVCSKCGFGGRVICCEYPGCRKVWHYSCAKLFRPPANSWCCPDHPDTTKFHKNMSSVSRTKTIANARSKNVKTEAQVSTKTPLPKKRSHHKKTVSPASTPPANQSTDKLDTSSVSRKRKPSLIPSETCSPLKKLKPTVTPLAATPVDVAASDTDAVTPAAVTPSDAATPVANLVLSTSRRHLRSSNDSDIRSPKDVFVEVNEAEAHQPEEIEKRKSSVIDQSSITTTRSTRKRKVNGKYETATSNNRRRANAGSRNSKTVGEPFSPLALNSNLPPRDGRRSNMVNTREQLVPSSGNSKRTAAPGTTTTNQNARTVKVVLNRLDPSSTGGIVKSPPMVTIPQPLN